MQIKQNILLLYFLISFFNSFSQTYFYDVGGSFGFNAFLKGNNKPSIFSTKKELTFAYYPDTQKGFRTGVSYANELEGSKALFIFPAYFAYRSEIKKPNGEIVLDSFSDLMNAIFPQRIELNLGPAFGFISRIDNYQGVAPTNNQYFQNEYVADRKIVMSLDFGIRPSYVLGRVNLFISLYAGLLISRNFIYTSDNIELMGIRPNIIVKGDFGISFAF